MRRRIMPSRRYSKRQHYPLGPRPAGRIGGARPRQIIGDKHMQHWKLALCAATATMALAGAAAAQDGPEISFNGGITSDYLFRGLTQNGGEAAAFVGADVSSGMFYAGTWASNVNFADAEVDLYAGVKPTVGPVSLDFGALYYGYVDSDIDDAAYWEFKAAGSIPAGPATVGAAVYYSPEFFGDTGQATYAELNAATTFSNKATLSGAFGHQWLDGDKNINDGYSTWNIGVTYPITDNFGIDVRYVGLDSDGKDLAGDDDTIVATLKATF